VRARRGRNARTPNQMAYSTASVGIATATYFRKVIALVPLFRSSLSRQWRRAAREDESGHCDDQTETSSWTVMRPADSSIGAKCLPSFPFDQTSVPDDRLR